MWIRSLVLKARRRLVPILQKSLGCLWHTGMLQQSSSAHKQVKQKSNIPNTCLGQMLQHLHYHWLNGRHFDEGKALLQQLFKFPVSVTENKQCLSCFSRLHCSKSKTVHDPPVLFLALSDDGHTLHQLFSKLVKDRLVELQPRRSVEVEEGQSGLEGRQQDAIFHLQSSSHTKSL